MSDFKMTPKFLKATSRGQIITDLADDIVAKNLQTYGAQVTHISSDDMTFIIGDSDYQITGSIERWEGTGARIRYDGKILIEPFDSTMRNRLSILVVITIVIASMWFIAPLSVSLFGTNGFFTYYNSHMFIALCVAIPIAWGAVKLINHDRKAKRRWVAQQKLGEKTELIHNMKI